ncbi:MAG TPA: hypothetical protein DCO72_06485 [Ruminococcus sp.]|nr:hypothetical protein [Ruminococcus sp.]
MDNRKKLLSAVRLMAVIVAVTMIVLIVISFQHQTTMACLSYFISVTAMLYIFYLFLNQPLELAENDTTICYISDWEMQYSTIYESPESVPDEVREGGYTFFCRGSGEDSHHVYMYSPDSTIPNILYVFSKYYCRLENHHGDWKSIFIYSKGNGLDRSDRNIKITMLAGILFVIIVGIVLFFYTNVKYQPEYRKFYDNNMIYHNEVVETVMQESQVLYNLGTAENAKDVEKHFKDCDFTLVLCEDSQGGYLFTKCICVNRSRYSVDIVNLNKYVNTGADNFETEIKNMGNDYPQILALAEDTFKIHFNYFMLLKYNEFSDILAGDTMFFTPPEKFVNAVIHQNTIPEEMTSSEKATAEYYLSTGLETGKMAFNYASYVSEIMNVEKVFLDYVRMNGKYPQTMEKLAYQMENDFLFSVLQNIAEQKISQNSDSKCIETNMPWDYVENLLILATYKDKSLYHSYYSEENTVSIPYTADCMWYESDTAFHLYTSQNYIDSLAIQWLYYTVGR